MTIKRIPIPKRTLYFQKYLFNALRCFKKKIIYKIKQEELVFCIESFRIKRESLNMTATRRKIAEVTRAFPLCILYIPEAKPLINHQFSLTKFRYRKKYLFRPDNFFGKPSTHIFAPERWQSGRMRRSWKPLTQKVRGFESLSLRSS